MRFSQIRLYSFTLPLALLPLMDFSLRQIPAYLKGTEFRNLVGEVVIQLVSGLAGTMIDGFYQSFFGLV